MRIGGGIAVTAALALALFGSGAAAAAEAGPCDEADIALATTPAPPIDAAHWRQYRRMRASLPASAEAVVVGDSLAGGWPRGKAAPLNLGIGGDRTQNVLWRLDDLGLSGLRPRLAILIAGTNNLSMNEPACAIAEGVGRVVGRMRALFPAARIVVLAIPPRGPAFGFRNEDRLAVNAALGRTLRDAPGTALLQADAELTCGFAQSCANYHPDGLHLAGPGYETLQKLVDALAAPPALR